MMNKEFIRVFGLVVIGLWIISCSSSEDKKESADEVAEAAIKGEDLIDDLMEESAPTDEPVVQRTDLSADVILGKWLRPDGNYVLEIKSIGKEGKLDAAYYNPRPIKMALSEVKLEDRIKVLIEFNDQGYEGSVYDLYYDETHDALVGSYFQATYGQTYQIAFIRYNQ